MPRKKKKTEEKPLHLKIFLFSCIPWPPGSTCPHTIHCWQLDCSTSPRCSVVGTASLKTFCLAHLSLCDFGWGFACEQEGRWNWWTEVVLLCVQGRYLGRRMRSWGLGRGHGCRASLPANRWQPPGECWIVQNVAVPYSDGKASGTVQLSTPFPAVFSHLCICCKTEWRLLWLVFALVTGKNKPFCFPVLLSPLLSLPASSPSSFSNVTWSL